MSAVTDSNLQDFQSDQFIHDLALELMISESRVRLVDLRAGSLQITVQIATDPVSISNSFEGSNATEDRMKLD